MNKKSKYLRNTFGVEFEFKDAELKDVAKCLRKLKLRHKVRKNAGWMRSKGKTWDIKTDSSVTEEDFEDEKNYTYGGEIASPAFIPSDTAFRELENVYEALLRSGAKFNKDCGLHIHVDITNIDRMKVLLTLLKFEKELYKGFMHRTKSEYAKPLKRLNVIQINKELPDKFSQLLAKKLITRYALEDHHSAFTFYNRNKLHMLEVRIGACTKNIDKTMDWIKLVLQKIKYAKTMDIMDELIED